MYLKAEFLDQIRILNGKLSSGIVGFGGWMQCRRHDSAQALNTPKSMEHLFRARGLGILDIPLQAASFVLFLICALLGRWGKRGSCMI